MSAHQKLQVRTTLIKLTKQMHDGFPVGGRHPSPRNKVSQLRDAIRIKGFDPLDSLFRQGCYIKTFENPLQRWRNNWCEFGKVPILSAKALTMINETCFEGFERHASVPGKSSLSMVQVVEPAVDHEHLCEILGIRNLVEHSRWQEIKDGNLGWIDGTQGAEMFTAANRYVLSFDGEMKVGLASSRLT